MTTAGGVTTFTVTEPLDWSFENPRALIRYQDGSASGLMVASRVGDFQLSVPHLSEFDDPMKVDLSSATIEPIRTRVLRLNAPRLRRHCREIAPQSDGTCGSPLKNTRNRSTSTERTHTTATSPKTKTP